MKLYHRHFYHVGPEEETHYLSGGDDDYPIGIFSSREKALSVAELLRTKPGSRKWPGGFRVLVSELDGEDYAFKEGLSEADDDEPWPPPAG